MVQKNILKHDGTKKEQIVYEIDKIAVVMHTLIFADGAMGAKNARDCSQKQYFEEGTE